MSTMVQVALASDVTEGEELQAVLEEAGIDAQLEPAVEHHPRETENVPTKVLVPESSIEDALAAIEALSETDDLDATSYAVFGYRPSRSRAPSRGRTRPQRGSKPR